MDTGDTSLPDEGKVLVVLLLEGVYLIIKYFLPRHVFQETENYEENAELASCKQPAW